MSQITINTSQNVEIERTTANVGLRIAGQLIDYLILGVYATLVFLIMGAAHIENVATYILFFLPFIFYSFIMESVFQGQSIAKMILKTRVVRLDGSQPTLFNFFTRWIFRIIEVLPFYGVIAIISIATGGKGQRLGDRAAGTTVISLQTKGYLKNSIYRVLNDDYELKFPQVQQLNEKDINTVNEVLNHYYKNPGIQARELMIKTKQAIIQKTGIDTRLESLDFLRTIVKDFNYMARNEEY
ncbi:MAG: RDD family protein [Bacteroidales bacterium]